MKKCTHENDIGIKCYPEHYFFGRCSIEEPQNCAEGEIRMLDPVTNRDGTIEGTVVVQYSQQWGTICDDIFYLDVELDEEETDDFEDSKTQEEDEDEAYESKEGID